MPRYSDVQTEFNTLREKVVGLGENSIRKNYYPELQQRIYELERSESKSRALVQAIPEMLLLLDEAGTVLEYKPVPNLQLAAPSDQILGRNIKTIGPDWIVEIYQRHAQDIFNFKKIKELEYEIETQEELRCYGIRGVFCGEDQLLFMIRDISEKKLLEKQLLYMGTRDFLTGLYNRGYFENAQREMIRRERSLGLVLCDVDGLKMINDSLGHQTGDKILKNAAEIIQRSFPPEAVIARIGGDEFGILLPGTTNELLNNACLTLSQNVCEYNDIKPNVPISISTGFAVLENPTPESFNQLFKEADNEMYRQKLFHSASTKSTIVKTLIKAMEARDFVTEEHSQRMEEIVSIIARNIGLSESSINNVRLLAQFHDLGKVGIPDSILRKPGRLTQEQTTIMQMHSLIGQRIANASNELAHIAYLILTHHERWDGQGYPLNLMGDTIPIECRILAIADAYDAMTNDRPYRKAMSSTRAVNEILDCSGTQFDPALVKIFMELIHNRILPIPLDC